MLLSFPVLTYAQPDVDIRGNHPRADGIWTQYKGLNTALRSNKILTDVIEPDSQFQNWAGEEIQTHNLAGQTAANYDDLHNHYQNFLSEVWNFKPQTNAVAIWGDSAAIANESGAWGAFFSARSYYKSFQKGGDLEKYRPSSFDANYDPNDYDTQLVGVEIDVLNSGKPGVYPNKSKVGLQIVGFGKPNSMAIEVRSEDTDKQVSQSERRGVWESGIYFKNSLAEYGRLLVADFANAKMGLDFRNALFSEGFIQAKSEGVGTGLILNSGKSGELYGGKRWENTRDKSNWLSIRNGDGGTRVVSNDNTRELIAVDNWGGIYLNGDVYVNGQKLSELIETSKKLQTLETKLQELNMKIEQLEKMH